MSDKLREEFEIFNKTRTLNRNMKMHPDGTYQNPERECAWQYYKKGSASHEPKHETVEQWEERTGETYPDDAPVWTWSKSILNSDDKGEWTLSTWEDEKGWTWDCIKPDYVANHHGEPEDV